METTPESDKGLSHKIQKADKVFFNQYVARLGLHLETTSKKIDNASELSAFINEHYYFRHLGDSVFLPYHLDDCALIQLLNSFGYGDGDGEETRDGGKMYSAFSSSALVVSAFGFPDGYRTVSINGEKLILECFEKQLPESRDKLLKTTGRSPRPNLDVWLENDETSVAVESKCFEPLCETNGTHNFDHGFSPAYLDENHYHHNGSIWVPFLRKLQSDQRLVNTRFDWPQNVKHLIGLSDSNAALKGKKLILADLFYDVDESNGGVLRQRYDVAQKEFGFFKETILEYGLPEKLGLNIGVISIPYSKLILENDYEHSDPRRFAFLKDRFYFNSLLK
ncbi:MAG: hypothetical protein BWY98_00055 [Tenericutes bacterium ADurb.BinA155]|jgi:hypothetical protein|nr:MAG: hypothetical protein BWY98_00055 [Tenericutes bacterium ADurb.BinA155]